MTKQETFDIVARHLLTQNEQALSPVGSCAYRSKDGKKCAIGCLIPDDRYEPRFEGMGILLNPELQDAVGPHDMELLDEMREVHDYQDPSDWHIGLREIAVDQGLSDAVVTELRGPAASQS